MSKTFSTSACLGALGTVFSTAVAMGCCAGFLAPLASLGAMPLPILKPSFQMPLLYLTVALTLTGLGFSYRRERSRFYLVSGFLGAIFLLIPFHAALDLSFFYLLIGLGLGLLLFASWGPAIWRFLNGHA